MSIVETATKASAKRVTYGIDIKAGQFTLNEWGLHESVAKEVNDILTQNGDKPFTIDGLTFSRRTPSELSAKLAAFKATMGQQPQG